MYTTPSKNAANDIKAEAAEAIYEVKDDLRDVANKAGRKLRTVYNTASDEIHDASEVVTSQIRKNPVQSSVIALGVGVLLGALLRR